MDLTTLMAYVFNCAVCTTIAIIFLLSPIKKQAQGKIDSYSKAKLCLAASAFIEALACLLYINCIVKAEPYIQLDHFTKPLFLYVAICIDLAAIVNLLHGKHAKARTIIFFVSPVAFLWLLHLIIYIGDYGLNFAAQPYSHYLTTMPSLITCRSLYAVFFIECTIILIAVNKHVSIFKQHIDNYYSGINQSRSRWLVAVVASIVIYYIVCIVDMCIIDISYDPLFLWLRTIIVIINSVAFIMCREIYWTVKPAFVETYNQTEDHITDTAAQLKTDTPAAATASPDNNTSKPQPATDTSSIDAIVTKWTRREDKPYLKESITIMQVAEQMGLNTRLLSNYLNSVKGRNFNAWINYLKVEETKLMLLADRSVSLSEIAFKMGFTDLASMSKIFKSIEGMPPSVYRQTH